MVFHHPGANRGRPIPIGRASRVASYRLRYDDVLGTDSIRWFRLDAAVSYPIQDLMVQPTIVLQRINQTQ